MSKKNQIKKILLCILSLLLLLPANLMPSATEVNSNIETYSEIKGEENFEKLIDDFKQNKLIPSNVTIYEEGNKIVIEQLLKKDTKNRSVDGEQFSTTVIETIALPKDDNQISTLDFVGTDGSDSSDSCKVTSTVYYDKVTYNNKSCVKMTKVTWSATCNSGVKIQKLVKRIGQSNLVSGNQVSESTDTTAATSKSGTIYPPSTWKPVLDIMSQYSSVVGVTLVFTLGRSSSSTWNYTYTNNIK